MTRVVKAIEGSTNCSDQFLFLAHPFHVLPVIVGETCSTIVERTRGVELWMGHYILDCDRPLV